MKIFMFFHADFAPKVAAKAWGVKFFQLIMADDGFLLINHRGGTY